MIKLQSDLWVAAHDVTAVRVNGGVLTVHTKGDGAYYVPNDYRKSVYDTADRIVAEVEAEMARLTN